MYHRHHIVEVLIISYLYVAWTSTMFHNQNIVETMRISMSPTVYYNHNSVKLLCIRFYICG